MVKCQICRRVAEAGSGRDFSALYTSALPSALRLVTQPLHGDKRPETRHLWRTVLDQQTATLDSTPPSTPTHEAWTVQSDVLCLTFSAYQA